MATLGTKLGSSYYPVVHWLWKGALVLEPNYRGSIGYGDEFRLLHKGALGLKDAADVIAGIEYLKSSGMVDPQKVGVMGWSYGGFISAWISATNHDVAAVSVGAGITDWKIHYGWESGNFTTRDFSFGGTPWGSEHPYDPSSPMTYIKDATIPTLFQHTEDDPIVPLGGARFMFRALQEQGISSRMIVYPGRTHGIPEDRQILGSLWHNWQWFGKHVWKEKVVMPY